MVEPKTDLKAVLTDAKPLLWQVSTCGAEQGGSDWSQLIQTLDRGSYDQAALFKLLRELWLQRQRRIPVLCHPR